MSDRHIHVVDYSSRTTTEGRLHEIAGQLQAIKEVLNRLVAALEQGQSEE